MTPKKAVYAGSFDPLTNGHLWMIEKGSMLFNEVVVAVAVNPDKKESHTFSLEDRLEITQDVTERYSNVSVVSLSRKYTAKYARKIGAQFMLRGIRSPQDYEYEREIREVNSRIDPDVLSVFLTPPPELSSVSSSMVKGLVEYESWEEVIQPYIPTIVYKKFLEKFNGYAERWEELWRIIGASGEAMEAYKQILHHYSEPHRAYHNIVHIAHSLQELDGVKSSVRDYDALELALFLHDVVYDTHALDNEEQSAEFARKMLGEAGVNCDFTEEVKALILYTKHKVEPPEQDARLLCDIDLAIIGQPEKVYDEFERNIRKEYHWVPEEIFRMERKKLLEAFLSRPQIYYTEHFRQKYEAPARENMGRAIINLS
ncbi:pantetheine-phosphate adenylyltransferase [Candidatus Woesearchaeota archaeon]|nr:pantetheine-phosphate adenylyltransferase [Candidatus Woesearchaeota archaeon]